MNTMILCILLCALGVLCYWLYFKCVDLGGSRYIKKFTGLLILSIIGFIYLMYVLVKPEKF